MFDARTSCILGATNWSDARNWFSGKFVDGQGKSSKGNFLLVQKGGKVLLYKVAKENLDAH